MAVKPVIKGFEYFLERLLKGFRSVENREPNNLEMILIRQEAGNKARDAAKVIEVDFGKPFSKEIEAMIKSGDVKVGKADKTPPYQKSQADIEFEIMEKIKSDNEKAVRAFESRNPNPKKMSDTEKQFNKDVEESGGMEAFLDANPISGTSTKRYFKGVEIKDPTFDETLPFDNDAEKLAEIKMSNEAYDMEKARGTEPKKAGKGRFTKAEYLIQRLRNTIRDNPDDPYVQENFPNFIKEIEAKPDLAKNENVFRELGEDLPDNQKIIVFDDDTLDFATLKPTKKFSLNKERFKKDFNVTDEEVEKISLLSPEDQQKKVREYIDKDFKERIELADYDVTDLEPNAEGGRAGHYTGGMVDVEPSLSDIGHGSDALMARTRLVSPNSQATTSTGLNYLLAEDNDNIRVPFSKGKLADAARRKFMKTAGGIGAGLAALKTGLIGLGEKAAPVVETAVEAAKGVPPYFFQLVDVIKSKGREIRSYGDRVKQYIAPSKDGKSELMLTEDLSTGDVQVKKIYKENDEMVTKSEEMNFTKGRGDETTKGTPADEYEEVTEYNSRIYKDEFNDPDVVDGIDVDEIVKEIDVKKASGGLAKMLGE